MTLHEEFKIPKTAAEVRREKRAQEGFGYKLNAIQGMAAESLVWTAMLTLGQAIDLFDHNLHRLPAHLKAQREVNLTRARKIATYIRTNRDNYILPPIVASIDGDFRFDRDNGDLHISMGAKLLVNDGQHRITALRLLRDELVYSSKKKVEQRLWSELSRDYIVVQFHIDQGLKRAQQMFADINGNTKTPTKSLTGYYDHRDRFSDLTRRIISEVPVFRNRTEFEKASVSGKSTALFSFAQLRKAMEAMTGFWAGLTDDQVVEKAAIYWKVIAPNLPGWELEARDPKEDRESVITVHAVTLMALAQVGNRLMRNHQEDLQVAAKALGTIEWERSNIRWRDGCVVEGKMTNNQSAIGHTVARIEDHINNARRAAAAGQNIEPADV